MGEKDIRWLQRFSNYRNAFGNLKEAVVLAGERKLTDLEEQGLIQAFEYTQELAWKVMKDYLEYQGITNIVGSRDAIRESFNRGLIEDGESWMDTIRSRNEASHTYNRKTAVKISDKIIQNYFALFVAFKKKMEQILSEMK